MTTSNETAASALIEAHGGQLKPLMAPESRLPALRHEALGLKSWDLTEKQVCDAELLLSGGFSPLDGLMAQADYEGIRDRVRLADGTLWPMPITLDVTEEFAAKVAPGERIALRHPEGMVLGIMRADDLWRAPTAPSKPSESSARRTTRTPAYSR